MPKSSVAAVFTIYVILYALRLSASAVPAELRALGWAISETSGVIVLHCNTLLRAGDVTITPVWRKKLSTLTCFKLCFHRR